MLAITIWKRVKIKCRRSASNSFSISIYGSSFSARLSPQTASEQRQKCRMSCRVRCRARCRRGTWCNYQLFGFRGITARSITAPLFLDISILYISTIRCTDARIRKKREQRMHGVDRHADRHKYKFIVPLNLWFATMVGAGCPGPNGLSPSVYCTRASSVLEKAAPTTVPLAG